MWFAIPVDARSAATESSLCFNIAYETNTDTNEMMWRTSPPDTTESETDASVGRGVVIAIGRTEITGFGAVIVPRTSAHNAIKVASGRARGVGLTAA